MTHKNIQESQICRKNTNFMWNKHLIDLVQTICTKCTILRRNNTWRGKKRQNAFKIQYNLPLSAWHHSAKLVTKPFQPWHEWDLTMTHPVVLMLSAFANVSDMSHEKLSSVTPTVWINLMNDILLLIKINPPVRLKLRETWQWITECQTSKTLADQLT